MLCFSTFPSVPLCENGQKIQISIWANMLNIYIDNSDIDIVGRNRRQTKTICKNRIPCSNLDICLLNQYLRVMSLSSFSILLSRFYLTNLCIFLVWRKSSIIFAEIRSSIAKMLEQCCQFQFYEFFDVIHPIIGNLCTKI